MKRLMIVTTILLWIMTGTAFAQQGSTSDPKAKNVLDKMGKVYDSYKDVSADFTFKLESPDLDKPETKKGKASIKGNKYKIIFTDQEIISDEKSVWVYLKETNEVTITTIEEKDESVTPNQLFKIYKTTKNRYIGSVTENGKTYHQIELYATKDETPFSKIQILINQSTNLAEKIKIFNRNGTQMTYEISNLKPNNNFLDSYFAFDSGKHPGVTVTDLR